jgi:hypothetical protein
MTVRAKFRVNNVRTNAEGKPNGFSMHPVYGESEENKAFFAATPGGTIDMWVTNPAVAEQFPVGAEFYVDFTPA